ncbi:NADP-dependent oxidoreductase [Pseudoclavibacter endophyticus]|nr:NADP-dependent oxidoreductase [Pseudoclavibacter endophyticus]
MTYSQYGDPSILTLTDRPLPKVAPGAVRINVMRAAVNPVDWKLMGGGLDAVLDVLFPVIPGWDVAGVVDAVGADTPEFSVGDRVASYARKDVVSGGTFAEYVSVPATSVARIPETVSFDEAAGLPLAGLTALRILETLEVTSDDTLLIHAASGGVGTFASQLAAARGATVIGTASPKHHERLAGHGITPVEYGDDLADRVREHAPDGVTAVADLVGGQLETTLAVLADGGRHASVADPSVEEHGGRIIWVRPDGERLARLLALVADGTVAVPVAGLYPLAEAASALEANRTGAVSGKVLIDASR